MKDKKNSKALCHAMNYQGLSRKELEAKNAVLVDALKKAEHALLHMPQGEYVAKALQSIRTAQAVNSMVLLG